MPVSPAEDSSFDDGNGDSNSLNSATTSLSSSIYNSHFVYGGRRYHCYRGTDYNLPIDDDEQRRLELMHTLWQVVGEGDIYKAPIPDNVQRVLDLGTGTGNWAIQFADSHPSAIVLGIDTSPIFPTWVPPNAQFELDNIESTWHMSSQNYDYIHIRNLSGSIRDWPALLQNIYDHLAPGGWLEIQEGAITEPFSVDGSYKKGGAYGRFNNLLRDSAVKSGKRLDIVPELPGWILATGFVDLHNKKEVCPIGRWPKDEKYKERGRWGLENLDLAMEAYGLLLMTQYGGLDEVEVREIIEDGKNDLWDKKIHMCFGMHFIYARKPMEGESTWT
ncbi:S-adenosyl-L-methionine-dependent methyltransferase [Ascobolus immersus RN42]|uniref:S-adenosyl-L-methionine-dependent methyltransferase n=1 Tax=Ascobolus immersus RN42 TaxID=1160509 RepID=A0A3N4IFS7_ASCIM|nr:S-adenosyl-L-methionine-dependent methyltransferase [Ascobolus immersus RN42]